MKIFDQPYHCEIPGQVFGLWKLHCRLKIFQPHPEVQTVVIIDMRSEMGWFIPYVVEILIDQIVEKFHLDPARLIWIEHFTPDFQKPTCPDSTQVLFEWDCGQAINPQRIALSPAMAEALISEELRTGKGKR